MSNTIFQNKRSSTTGTVPPSLVEGTFAINLVDKRIFTANSTVVFDALQNTVVDFSISNNTSGAFRVGNSTVNSVVNSTSFKISNSVSSITISAPNTVQFSGSYYLKADGTWATVAGGSANPAGSNTQVQFNNSGAFGASAGFTFDSTSNTIAVGNSTQYSTINSASFNLVGNNTYLTAPSTANIISISTVTNAKKSSLLLQQTNWKNNLSPHLLKDRLYYLLPKTNSTVIDTMGMTSANTTALVVRPIATSNLYLSATRCAISTGATAGTSANIRSGQTAFWRGNAAGLGGFYAISRWGIDVDVANATFFVGFLNSLTVPTANTDATALNNHMIGFCRNPGQTNVYAYSTNGTANISGQIDTGFNASVGNTNWYETTIYCPQNSNTVSWSILNLATGSYTEGNYTNLLPTSTTLLGWHWHISNRTAASAFTMSVGGVLIETKY